MKTTKRLTVHLTGIKNSGGRNTYTFKDIQESSISTTVKQMILDPLRLDKHNIKSIRWGHEYISAGKI